MQVLELVKSLRISTVILGISNLVVGILGGFLVLVVFRGCDSQSFSMSVAVVSLGAGVKIFAMVCTGMAQKATANAILDSPAQNTVADNVDRLRRRMSYKTWRGWSHFAMIITLLQTISAFFLLFYVVEHISEDGRSYECSKGMASDEDQGKLKLLLLYVFMACVVPLVHCAVGSDVLSWRSFYATQDDAWRVHYQEVFDHGIREVLCCMGRVKYLRVSNEDEVYSVAKLLGDLVAYRASGTGHLELLAGLALLHRRTESPEFHDGQVEAPEDLIQEAFKFHEFSEAAYTGPLLDFGRHTVCFSCAWLYRQGVLTPWTRNRRPVLTGDNWWRGHAAAFLKYVNLPGEALRQGRVCQEKCEAAYFIVVVHHLRSVVIAVRGTETPEDLITDGLGRESPLSMEDLHGLMNSSYINPDVKQRVDSSFPHYGHSGIVKAARDLYMQIEGKPYDGSESGGFLTSLLGAGCECDGYNVCIIGHSLGGAIAALLGIRLYSRYPSLHVYAYGPLPCVDLITAEACSDFVTSIIHDNEFSARLSVGSILRLRAATIMALTQDSKADTALILRLARRFLYVGKHQSGIRVEDPSDLHSATTTVQEQDHGIHKGSHKMDQIYPLWDESDSSIGHIEDDQFENPFYTSTGAANSSDIENPFCASAEATNSLDDPVSRFLETVPKSGDGLSGDHVEMFLPGLVIHMVPEQRVASQSLWKSLGVQASGQRYKAYLAKREMFKDIVVSPSMFLDHLPWRCRNALRKVLEGQSMKGRLDGPYLA